MKNVKWMMLMMFCTLLLVAGCTQKSSSDKNVNASNAEDKNPIKIGIVMPLTGPSTLYGNQTVNGGKIAAKIINASGGILGNRKIELLTEDDQSKPEIGVKAYSKLMERDKVDVISGGANSSVSMATKNVAANKMLNIVTTSKAPDIMKDRDRFQFRLNTTNDMDGKLFHEFIAKELKPKTVAVIAENTDYGQAEIKALKQNWAKEGSPEIKQVEYFQLTDTDYTNPLTKLKALNADAIYVVGSSIEINSAIFKQAYQLGFQNKMKLLASGQLNTKLLELAGPGSQGIISADIYLNTIDNEINKQFVSEFEKEYGNKPEKMEELGFEAIWLIAKAIDKAGSATNYEVISKALEANEWQTPRGIVKFKDGQALGEAAPLMVRDGKIIAY